jgi:hypothetical protein
MARDFKCFNCGYLLGYDKDYRGACWVTMDHHRYCESCHEHLFPEDWLYKQNVVRQASGLPPLTMDEIKNKRKIR